MKALVLEEVGKLVYRDVETPCPKAGEVLLHVRACGICSSDFDRCFKTGTYHFPTIPGHEFCGQIVAVGDGVDTNYIGRRAVVFPLMPCRTCDQCQVEAYARCRNYNYFGSRCDGAFSEYVAVPLWNIQTFSDKLDFKVAALCEPAAVAYHGASSAMIASGESVCVVGTGTIGILAGIWAREFGGVVSFMSRSERKNDFISGLGFNSFVTAERCSGFDKVIECVGTDSSLEGAIKCVKPAGRIVLVGNPDAEKRIDRKVYWKILREEINIQGIWNSCYSAANNEWRKVIDMLEVKQDLFARLITSVFPLSVGAEAFVSMKRSNKLEIKGMFVNE